MLLFFEVGAGAAESHNVLPDFGALDKTPVPPYPSPAVPLYSNAAGSHTFSKTRFFFRCLHLYRVFCHRFMPEGIKSKLIAEVARATRLAEEIAGNPQTATQFGAGPGGAWSNTGPSTGSELHGGREGQDMMEDVPGKTPNDFLSPTFAERVRQRAPQPDRTQRYEGT